MGSALPWVSAQGNQRFLQGEQEPDSPCRETSAPAWAHLQDFTSSLCKLFPKRTPARFIALEALMKLQAWALLYQCKTSLKKFKNK